MARVLFVLHDYLVDPLGPGCLSTVLKAAGHETQIVKSRRESVRKRVKSFQPDVLAFSVTTGWQTYYAELSRKIKSYYDCVSIFGGPHATFNPEDLINRDDVDAVCRGEGEKAIVAFADSVDRNSIAPVPNIWTKAHQNGFHFDLLKADSIPEPDRELIYSYPENRANPIKNVMASRGCMFNCSYCYNHAMKQIYPAWRVRRRSPELIAVEVRRIKDKYPLELVFFQDDVFVSSTQEAEEFARAYRKEARVPFHAQMRYDVTSDGMLKLLKEAGCESVTFAVESSSPDICKRLLHRPPHFARLGHVVDTCKRLGIKVRTECMVGLPEETIADSLATLDLCTSLKPDIAWCSLYQPYPETELGKRSIDLGLFDGDLSRFKPDFFSNSLLSQPHKSLFENLQKFFSLAVAYPRARKIVEKLIQLPPNPLFKRFYSKFKKHLYGRLYAINT